MCGIFAVWNAPKAAELTVMGLHVIQHRAIDYAGIVSSDGVNLYRECGKGVARDVFTSDKLNRLHGKSALGHIRYPTVSDDKTLDNIQPIMGIHGNRLIAIAHNGNLTNTEQLEEMIHTKFATSMDTECIPRLLEKHDTGHFERDIISVLVSLRGSFSLGILLPDKLIAIRDKTSNRPLSIGRAGESYFISSETCAFPNVGAEYVQDVEPGTIVTIGPQGIRTTLFAEADEKKCRFEVIYFSHPASVVFGEHAGHVRVRVGRMLEELYPAQEADIVVPIPDSGNLFALGFSKSGRSGKLSGAISRNHYVGRTFIAATQAGRDEEVSKKFIFSSEEIRGKSIVVVDDSLVRGTTLCAVISHLRRLHARAVHVRVGFPPVRHPCRYGVNTREYKELMASSLSVEEIRARIGADSLEFLPLEALKKLSPEPEKFCYACITGDYW